MKKRTWRAAIAVLVSTVLMMCSACGGDAADTQKHGDAAEEITNMPEDGSRNEAEDAADRGMDAEEDTGTAAARMLKRMLRTRETVIRRMFLR